MSEFKFNCPVCGQHIATESHASGAQIECPTCFQPIIVPQAPTAQTKYILSATQYIKPQPVPRLTPASAPVPAKSPAFAPGFFLALFLVSVLGVAAYVVYSISHHRSPAAAPASATNSAADSVADKNWRLDLVGVSIPDQTATGRIRNQDFVCERAYLQNGTLALRQGPVRQPEMIVNVFCPVREPQELAGKRFSVGSKETPAIPGVALRWSEGRLRASQPYTNGYALRLEFGSIEGDRVPGRIYLCFPDASKSYVAGSFTAEIRVPPFNKLY